MQQTNPHLNLWQAIAPRKPAFKVLAAYENHAALFQAGKTLQQVELLCDSEAEVLCGFWNFALFRSDELREYACKEAGLAEMIIISLHGGQEIPSHVRRWVESWPVQSQTGRAALVVLSGHGSANRAERMAQITYLRQRAEICRLDFLCNLDEALGLDFPQPSVRCRIWKGISKEAAFLSTFGKARHLGEGSPMPALSVMNRARQDRWEGKAPSTQAGEFVREEFHHIREGKHGARSVRQAIAIGLSKARRAGVRLPPPKKGKVSKATRRHAQRDYEKGLHRHGLASSRRSRAIARALSQAGFDAASRTAISRHARTS